MKELLESMRKDVTLKKEFGPEQLFRLFNAEKSRMNDVCSRTMCMVEQLYAGAKELRRVRAMSEARILSVLDEEDDCDSDTTEENHEDDDDLSLQSDSSVTESLPSNSRKRKRVDDDLSSQSDSSVTESLPSNSRKRKEDDDDNTFTELIQEIKRSHDQAKSMDVSAVKLMRDLVEIQRESIAMQQLVLDAFIAKTK